PKLTKFEEVAGEHGGELSELHQKNSSFPKGPPDGRSLSSAARRKPMISIPSQTRARGLRTTVALSLALTGLLFFPAFSGQNADGQRGRSHHQQEEKSLFVWTGDQARTAPDFLAVVDFDPNSAGYGRAITTVPLPGPGASGNEPHHVGLSDDGNVLG